MTNISSSRGGSRKRGRTDFQDKTSKEGMTDPFLFFFFLFVFSPYSIRMRWCDREEISEARHVFIALYPPVDTQSCCAYRRPALPRRTLRVRTKRVQMLVSPSFLDRGRLNSIRPGAGGRLLVQYKVRGTSRPTAEEARGTSQSQRR